MYAFHTFGSVYLADASGPLSGPATQRRRLAVLALLASASAGGLSRDKLIACLWPELSDDAGRSRLADALHGLRRTLGREAILSAGDDVRLNTALVRADLVAFEHAVAAGDHGRAAALYRGPFLDGFHVTDAPEFERWVEEERQRLAREYARALEALAEEREAAGDTRAAVEWWRRFVVHDPYSSRVTLRLMQALSASGDAAAALRHAQVHGALLRDELDVEPDADIRAFAEQLRHARPAADRAAGRAPAHGSREAPGPSPGASPETSPDASPDTSPDTSPETSLDTSPETSPQASADTVLDASPGTITRDEAAAHAAAPELGIRLRATGTRAVSRRRLRYGGLALAGAAVLVGVAAAARWDAGRRAAPALDPETILITPFRVAADPSLDYLGEGLVDLLATSLNGVAGSRAVDPRSTLAAWRRAAGRANADLPPTSAAEVARRLGAGQLLMGSVSGTPEQLTLHATLYGAARTAVRMRVSSHGPADSLPALVDRLIGQILAREAGVPRHQLETLTTTSLPALRAYLEGVQSYRLGRFGHAVELFEEALRVDSTFALAAIQLALAAGWGQLTAEPGTTQRAARLAWAARDRLSLPDRLLLEAFPGPRFPEPSPPHELYAARVRALDASPDRPEALYLMGAYHLGGILRGEEDALARSSFFFRRAIELDSAYAAPLYNVVREAALAGDTATAQRLTRRYLAADSTSEIAHLLQWVRAATSGDEAAILDVRARMPAMHPTALGWIEDFAVRSGLDIDGGEAALAALGAAARSEREWGNYRVRHWEHLGNRGRLRAMWSSLDSAARAAERWGPIEHLGITAAERARGQQAVYRIGRALFWDADTAGLGAATARMMIHQPAPLPDDAFARVVLAESACFGGIARLHAGRTAAAREAVTALRRVLDGRAELPNRPTHASCAATLDALIAAADGRPDARVLTERADSVLRAAPPTRIAANRMQLLLARAFEALDDPAAALRVIRRHGPNNGPFFLAVFLREEGRLAARTGDEDGAIRAYRHYLALRTDPDPELVAEVEHVRAALAELLAKERR